MEYFFDVKTESLRKSETLKCEFKQNGCFSYAILAMVGCLVNAQGKLIKKLVKKISCQNPECLKAAFDKTINQTKENIKKEIRRGY